MNALTIRPAEKSEYDEIARVWMESRVSVGLEGASEAMLAELRERVPRDVAGGWSLYRWKKGSAS
jgi:hypothetical protein